MRKIYLTGVIIGMFMMFLLGGVSAALTSHEQDVYKSITNPFVKLSYAFQKGFFFFTSWGQENGCSTYPDWDGWIRGSMSKPTSIPSSVSCSKVGANKCAIDIWYDNTIYLSGAIGPPNNVNYNNWLKEVHGTGVSFSSTSRPYYYVEVYACPDVPPTVEEHSTRAYTCESGSWSNKGSYDNDEYCAFDTSGEKRCWCSDEDDNFYVDSLGGVHCQSSSYSRVNDGTWCPAQITVYRLSNNQCIQKNIYPSERSSFDYDTLTQCQAAITSGGTGDGTGGGGTGTTGDIRLNGEVQVIPPGLFDFNNYLSTFKVPVKNFGTKTEVINLEVGFYSQTYACDVAKLFPCPGTLASIFPFFSSVPVPNVNPAEEFVSTRQVTLAPGQSEVVEFKVNHISGFATYPIGKTNVKEKPMIWFAGLYKTPAGGYINEAGITGKGTMFDYAQYNPNNLLGGCDNVIGPATTDILCGGTNIGSCQGDILTLTATCDITPTLEVINGTTATAKATTLGGGKKIALTKEEISSATSQYLLASSCLEPSECLTTNENYTTSCVSIAKLREDGVLTESGMDNFFDNAKKTINYGVAGGVLGGSAGLAACLFGVGAGTTVILASGGVLTPVVIPAALSCSSLVLGGAAAGTVIGTTISMNIGTDDELLNKLKAEDANAVGICVQEPKSAGLEKYTGWAAWFNITGDKGIDGLIIIVGMVLIFFLFAGGGRR